MVTDLMRVLWQRWWWFRRPWAVLMNQFFLSSKGSVVHAWNPHQQTYCQNNWCPPQTPGEEWTPPSVSAGCSSSPQWRMSAASLQKHHLEGRGREGGIEKGVDKGRQVITAAQKQAEALWARQKMTYLGKLNPCAYKQDDSYCSRSVTPNEGVIAPQGILLQLLGGLWSSSTIENQNLRLNWKRYVHSTP